MLSLQSNVAALRGIADMRRVSLDVSGAMERLSSGRRINRAADDPTALGIGKRLNALARGLIAANMNVQDSIGFLQLRDGAMAEVSDILMRLRELAVRAASEATLTDEDRQKLSGEASKLVKQINQINENTKFNERKVFMPYFSTVPGGLFGPLVHSGQVSISIDLAEYAAASGGVVTVAGTWFDGWLFFPDINLISPDGTEAFGWLYGAWQSPNTVEAYVPFAGAQVVNNGDSPVNAGVDSVPAGAVMDTATQILYDGWAAVNEEVFTITDPAPGLWTIVIDNEDPEPRKYGVFVNEPSMAPVEIDRSQIGAFSDEATNMVSLGTFEVDTIALGLSVNFSSADSARSSIDSVDSALEYLNIRRAENGIVQRKLGAVVDENLVRVVNLTAGTSNLEDADMVEEAVRLSKGKIITQTASAASMYAASQPRHVLDLETNHGIGMGGVFTRGGPFSSTISLLR
ncbi:MAG: flagellin [bacterium]